MWFVPELRYGIILFSNVLNDKLDTLSRQSSTYCLYRFTNRDQFQNFLSLTDVSDCITNQPVFWIIFSSSLHDWRHLIWTTYCESERRRPRELEWTQRNLRHPKKLAAGFKTAIHSQSTGMWSFYGRNSFKRGESELFLEMNDIRALHSFVMSTIRIFHLEFAFKWYETHIFLGL